MLLFETSEVTTTVGLPVPRLDLNLVEEGSVLTSVYAFAVFGVGWLLAAFGWVHFWRRRNELTDSTWLFWITTLIATMMLGGFNLLIGSIRENRIWFLAFPWVIRLGTLYLGEHWRNLAMSRNVRSVALISIVLMAPVVLFLLLVPGGGGGARLEALLRLPGLTFVYESIWLQFSYRFNYIRVSLSMYLCSWHSQGCCSSGNW